MSETIIYCAVSFERDRNANVIQSESMVNALESIGCEVHEVWKTRGKTIFNRKRTLIHQKDYKLSHYFYLIFMPLLVLWKFKSNAEAIFFTRSVIVGFILGFFTNKSVLLEFHNAPRWRIETFLLRYINKKTKFIFISNAIRDHILSSKIYNRSIVVADSHDFKIRYLGQKEKFTKETDLKIGYFGKFDTQKGSEILRQLIKNNPEWEFYIYTLNKNDLYGKNIQENRYLERFEVEEKMQKLDILLLFVVPNGQYDDISQFTSPLKLFEYAATGKLVVASDVKVLKELERYNAIFFAKNHPTAFAEAIKTLQKSAKLQSELRSGLRLLATENTWNKRAKKITLFAKK